MILISRFSLKYDSILLLRHWLQHYQAEGIREFHIFLDTKEGSSIENGEDDVLKALGSVQTHIVEIDTTCMTESEQLAFINDYRYRVIGKKFAWTADADEFIRDIPFVMKQFDEQIFDGIRGIVIDRFAPDGELIRVPDIANLWKTFPLCSFFSRVSLNANIRKVAYLRGTTPYEKVFHQASEEDRLIFPNWSVSYHHFKWTQQLLLTEQAKKTDRFFDNPYYKKELNFLFDNMIREGRVDLSEVDCWLAI